MRAGLHQDASYKDSAHEEAQVYRKTIRWGSLGGALTKSGKKRSLTDGVKDRLLCCQGGGVN